MRKLFGIALGAAALALSTLALVQPASAGWCGAKGGRASANKAECDNKRCAPSPFEFGCEAKTATTIGAGDAGEVVAIDETALKMHRGCVAQRGL